MEDLPAKETSERRRQPKSNPVIAIVVYGGAVVLGIICTIPLFLFVFSYAYQGTLELHLEPPDARITIDGSEIDVRASAGKSPIKLLLATGSHKLRVSKSGYVSATETVRIERNQTRQVKIELRKEAAPVGSVELFIDQPGAQIFLDGRPISVTVPGNLLPIVFQWPVGQYDLRVTKSGFPDHSERLSVEKGKKTQRTIRLKR